MWSLLSCNTHTHTQLFSDSHSDFFSVQTQYHDSRSNYHSAPLTCLMKSSGRCSWSSRHFSSSPTKKLVDRRGGRALAVEAAVSLHPTPLTLDLLSVPVVDLVDVPEHDLVFSLHVIGDALLLDSLHEALQGVAQGQWREQRRKSHHQKPSWTNQES